MVGKEWLCTVLAGTDEELKSVFMQCYYGVWSVLFTAEYVQSVTSACLVRGDYLFTKHGRSELIKSGKVLYEKSSCLKIVPD